MKSLRLSLGFVLLGLSLMVVACSSTTPNQKVNVAIASSLYYPLQEIKKEFESSHDIQVNLIKASSGKLSAQIEHGAPYDVFMSANMKFVNRLYKKGLTFAAPQIFTKGALVMWSFDKDFAFPTDFKEIKTDAIEKIAIAHTTHAPCGIAGQEALEKSGLMASLKGKVVVGESIAQVNQYVVNQTVTIGITSKGSVFGLEASRRGRWLDVPQEFYAPLYYGLAEINNQKKSVPLKTAKQFIKFLTTPYAQKVFSKYGFDAVQPNLIPSQ